MTRRPSYNKDTSDANRVQDLKQCQVDRQLNGWHFQQRSFRFIMSAAYHYKLPDWLRSAGHHLCIQTSSVHTYPTESTSTLDSDRALLRHVINSDIENNQHAKRTGEIRGRTF